MRFTAATLLLVGALHATTTYGTTGNNHMTPAMYGASTTTSTAVEEAEAAGTAADAPAETKGIFKGSGAPLDAVAAGIPKAAPNGVRRVHAKQNTNKNKRRTRTRRTRSELKRATCPKHIPEKRMVERWDTRPKTYCPKCFIATLEGCEEMEIKFVENIKARTLRGVTAKTLVRD